MREHFFLTLDSRNTTAKGNAPGRFTTRLPAPVQLSDGWCVALLEIRYPKSWWNIPTTDYFLEWQGKKIGVPPGFYGTPTSLVEMISQRLKKWTGFSKNAPQLWHDASNNRLDVIRSAGLRFSDPLRGVLGIDLDQVSRPSFRGLWEVDMQSAFHRLFVYTDCVKDAFVGGTTAPLLRPVHVPLTEHYGDMVHITYDQPWYVPLSRHILSDIEVVIADELGRQVEFRGGKGILVTLHFRNG